MKRSISIFSAASVMLFAASPAAAQQGLEKFTNLATTGATFVQAISLIGCAAFMALAGVNMAKGDMGASDKVSMGVKGTAVTAGAFVIVTVIKEALL